MSVSTTIHCPLQYSARLRHCVLYRGCIVRTLGNLWTSREDEKQYKGNLQIPDGLTWRKDLIYPIEDQKADKGKCLESDKGRCNKNIY
jgi:hypothetical protein